MSDVTVKMNLSPAKTGALYMKFCAASGRVKELEAMLTKKLDIIKCGIAHNYGGDPYENEKYTEVTELLNKK